jgi:hypothetical protein
MLLYKLIRVLLLETCVINILWIRELQRGPHLSTWGTYTEMSLYMDEVHKSSLGNSNSSQH